MSRERANAAQELAGASNVVQKFLRRWSEDGRSQCLQHLITLAAQPDKIEEVRLIIQSLVNALVASTSSRLSPDDLANFYIDLVCSQPSSSTAPDQVSIHRVLLDSVSVVDDVLEDRAAAKEASAKEKDKAEQGREQKDAKEKQQPRNIPERLPLVHLIRHLLTNNIITQEICAVTLDYALLHDVGLLRDAGGISRMEVRARTRLIYRQTKVNLLREQSEGYSKFAIELSSSMGPPQDVSQATELEYQASIIHSSHQATDRLMKIGGYFDLDPTRMLDLIVDVFSTHVMTHYCFFIHLIRRFTGSRTRLLNAGKRDGMQVDGTRSFKGMDFEDVLIAAEGDVLVVPSSTDLRNPLAQLLGFKFRHYSSNGQNLPQSLVFVAAILIREGLLSIRDLYEHLSPDEEGMDSLRQKYEDEMRKRIRTVKTTAADKDNALANAPVLSTVDDRDFGSRRPPPPPPQIANTTVTNVVKEPKTIDELNQHRELAIALLSIGALRPGLFLLTKYPWLSSRYPQLADVLLSHLELSIDPVYAPLSTGAKDPRAAVAYAMPLKRRDNKLPQVKLTMTFPVPPPTRDMQLVFFFSQYTERIPICSSVEDFPSVVGPLLRIIGAHGYRHLPVFIKLCRIGRGSCQDENDVEADFWKYAIRVHFLPLLSMARDNPLLGIELWPLLDGMEVRERWSIYAEWLHHTYETNLEMRLKKALVTREVKGVLRRLNAKNQGQSARALAKIAHHNPCVVFNIAIGQVMSYDNLADPLMEALRTLTSLGYDVLTFCLLDAFSQPDRPRMKDDGTNVSHWLQSLASFTAHLCRRYSQIDPTPILQFIVHRLLEESPPDAIILRELVSKMSGIEPLQMLSDNQVAAMGGGPILQTETVASETRGALQAKQLQRSADKLLSAMFHAELMFPILILLARLSQQCVYTSNTNEAILKGLGSTFDDLRGIFFQYVTFLSLPSVPQRPNSMKMRNDFFANLPPLDEIVNQYGVEAGMVFHMSRAPLQRSIVEQAVTEDQAAKAALPTKEETSTETEARLRAQVAATRENSIEDSLMQVDLNSSKPWLPVLLSWIDAVSRVLPPRVNTVMGAPFFVTFWQLTLFETMSLVKQYKEQVIRITKLAEDHARTESSLSSMPSRERIAWSDKRDRLELFKEHLVKESNEHVAVYGATKKRLGQEKLYWFDSVDSKSIGELPRYIVQYCLFPRALLTPMDADFAAQFIKVLHSLGTKGFWTIRCYEQIFGPQLGSVIFSCTQNEARNYGRFLRGVLRDLATWYKEEAMYTADTKKGTTPLPGFAKAAPSPSTTASGILSWPDFKKFVKKIHMKLCSALTASISMSNGEFMHVSNSILVLKEILPVFPLGMIYASTGQFLDNALQQLLSEEKRGDIKLLATSYQGQLRMVKREWAGPNQASGVAETPAAVRANGHAGRQPPAGPKESSPSNAISNATTAARAALRQSAAPIPSMQHPLPANPSRSRAVEAANEIKTVERPQVIKRINREATISRDPEETSKSTNAEVLDRMAAPRLQSTETSDPSLTNSPRPANGQPTLSHKDVPVGPRNPRGHRLTEDPSSRPPPSASMQPPKGSVTAPSQDTRPPHSHQTERTRLQNTGDRENYPETKPSGRGDASRPNDNSRVEQRRRSMSPARPGVENSQDNRRREDERGTDRRSARDDARRPERRSAREDDRDREREKDRRGDRDRDRDRDGGRRDRDSAARATTSRADEPSHVPGSPHRADDGTGRKRTRDPREEDPSDRSSKRPTRERERDKDKDRERRDRSTRDKDKDHRHRERKRDKEDGNSGGVSPRDTDGKDKDGSKNNSSATPSAPRAMIIPDDKRLLSNTFEAVRRDRETAEASPSGRQQSSHSLHSIPASRLASHGPRREFRDDRGADSYAPSVNANLTASLASRIENSTLPPRPAFDHGRDGDRSDLEGQRKRTASARSQEDIAGNSSSSKRVKINRNFNN